MELHQFILHLFTTTSRPLALRRRLTAICYDADCSKDYLRALQREIDEEMEDPNITPNRYNDLSERMDTYVEGIRCCEMIYEELFPHWYVPHV